MNTRIAILLFLLIPATAFADLVPIEYDGMSIVPATNTDISMREEIVDIFVRNAGKHVPERYVCDVRADFIMENSTDRCIDILVGFPVQLLYGQQLVFRNHLNDDIYRFAAKANGAPVDSISTSKVYGEFFTKRPADCLWMGWEQSFSPGTTRIEVEYSFVTTQDKVYSASTIGYSLYSGSFWNGPIGSARLVVHFPREMDREFMSEIRPEGYVIDGDRMLWDLKDFEPGTGDNIRVGFLQFGVIEEIETARSKCASGPSDAESKAELAKAYLRTMNNKGKDSMPGWKSVYIEFDDFGRFLDELGDDEERAFVESIFVLQSSFDDLGHERKFFARDKERADEFPRLEKILIDHRFKYHIREDIWYDNPYTREAERLILEVLDEDLQNCYVWNLYLSHFFKILPGTWGPVAYSMRNEIIPTQREMIEKACKSCPGDSGIALWKDLIDGTGPDFFNVIRYIEEIEDNVTLYVEIPGRCGSFGKNISPEDVNVIFAMYEPSDTVSSEESGRAGSKIEARKIYLRLRKEPVPRHIRDSIKEMLRWNPFLRGLNGEEIREYNVSAGIY